MDFSWLSKIESPLALLAVIIFLFIGAVVLIWRLSATQNAKLVDKFLDRADKQNEKLVQVVEKNTEAATKQAGALENHTQAIHRLATVVETKLEARH